MIVVLVIVGILSPSGNNDKKATAATTTTRTTTQSTKTGQTTPAKPAVTRVAVRVVPSVPTYVCVDRGAGTPVVFEGTISSSKSWRGRHIRMNLGKTSVSVTGQRQARAAGGGSRPRGPRLHPARPQEHPGRQATLRMSVRAGIVVTGTEVLSGTVSDRNGPWLADRLFELGIDLAHITIVGDRPEDMEAQLRFMADQGVELIVTTGGLGPTADDLTGEVVARFQERPLELSAEMEAKIAEILKPLMRRFDHLDPEAVMAANRKQALVPTGATTIDPAGTAPGSWCRPRTAAGPHGGGDAGPSTRAALDVAARGGDGRVPGRGGRAHRLRGADVAAVRDPRVRDRRDAEGGRGRGGSFAKVEITTCLRRGEVEVTARYEPDGAEAWAAIEELIAERHPRALFSRDGKRIDDQVAELLTGRWVAAASRARADCSWRGSPSDPVRRRTWRVGSSRTRTRRRATCWALTPR